MLRLQRRRIGPCGAQDYIEFLPFYVQTYLVATAHSRKMVHPVYQSLALSLWMSRKWCIRYTIPLRIGGRRHENGASYAPFRAI